jgi:hypothetical protein
MPDSQQRAKLAIVLITCVFVAGVALGYLLATLG